MTPLKILFAASECVPYAKAGGLGDVIGPLATALAQLGHDVRVVLPRYDSVSLDGLVRHEHGMAVPLGDGEAWCAVYETRLPGSDVRVYLLDHRDLFARGYLYDPPGGWARDNLVRFAFLSRGALQLCGHLDWKPDVVHVHDWPTSLVPVYLNTVERGRALGRTASVLTIHNLAHQGVYPKDDLWRAHVPWSEFRSDGLEDHGNVNLLKGGLYHATMLTTVSPKYAQEIRTAEGGAGLDGVLRFRGADLVGILNGIDDRVWNPATDPHIAERYDARRLEGKARCKAELQAELGLEVRPDRPVIGLVSRLGSQKGSDVVVAAIPALLELGAQLVVLGSGEPELEQQLRAWSHHARGRFHAFVGFDERRAHRIQAGSDFLLVPSRFEPCGLTQMFAQRYGTLPIVRATGGLDDTVENYDPRTGEGSGFKVWDLSVGSLVETVRWALRTWRDDRARFSQMQQRVMHKQLGWSVSARKYEEVYRWAVERRTGGVR